MTNADYKLLISDINLDKLRTSFSINKCLVFMAEFGHLKMIDTITRQTRI